MGWKPEFQAQLGPLLKVDAEQSCSVSERPPSFLQMSVLSCKNEDNNVHWMGW